MHMEKKKKQSLGYSTLVILQQMTLPMYLNTTHVSSTGKRKKKKGTQSVTHHTATFPLQIACPLISQPQFTHDHVQITMVPHAPTRTPTRTPTREAISTQGLATH